MYKKRVVLLTGNELRHMFFRKAIALHDDVTVLMSVCEDVQLSLANRVEVLQDGLEKDIMRSHVQQREQSEIDFFSAFVNLVPDKSNPFIIPKGKINEDVVVEKIISLQPDLILVYGSSLLKGKLIDIYGQQLKIINLHLGLSPYYRGAGTNFWALVNKEPECVGSTFMFLDAGIDTGNIIHQIRARVYENDTPHSIGNRLIVDSILSYVNVIQNLETVKAVSLNNNGKLYTRKQFCAEAVEKLYYNFENNMIKEYLKNKNERDVAFPIVSLKDNIIQ